MMIHFMKESKIGKNIIWGFGGQLILVALGIVVPRIIITNYGSDVNGLLNTVSQIFTYMALLEAGIGQAAKNAMYKPLAEKNLRDFSCIAATARRYFRRITLYYGIGVLAVSFLAPLVIHSNISHSTIFFVVLFEGLSGVVSFFFVQTKTIILGVDGRGYVNNGINVVNKVLSYIARIVLAGFGINIAVLQFVYFIITICKVIFYSIYFNKNYKWIDFSNRADQSTALKDRNSYIITEIAWTIFSSTDLIVLSLFLSTKLASVYSIYSLVFTNISVLLTAVYSSVNYLLGTAYHKGIKNYQIMHDTFNSVFLGAMTVLMSVAYILIIPFIKLYTRGVTDVNYVYTSLPIMFCMVQIMSWSRYVSGNLTGIAGYAKQTSKASIVEASINVVLSVALVQHYGIVGVLFATVFALPVKVIYCTYIADRIVMHRTYTKTLCLWVVNYSIFALAVVFNTLVELPITNYLNFALYGVVLTVAFSIIGVVGNILANLDCAKILYYTIKQRKSGKNEI